MQFTSNPPNTARQYSVWLCFKCSILHRLSLYCQGDISWGGPGGCLCASSPLCCLHVREDGGKAKKRIPLSPCEVGTLGKIEAKKSKLNSSKNVLCELLHICKTRNSKPAVYTRNMFIIMQWHWLLDKNLWAQNLLLYSFIKAIPQLDRAFITTLPVETDGHCLSALFI